MSNQARTVTETEFAILGALWDRGPSTVREIVESVYGEHTHSLHASVKSLLGRLSGKELVKCEKQGSAHFFTATSDRREFVASQLQLLADDNFGGSLGPLLLTLADSLELNGKDRAAIERIIDGIE